MNNENTTSTIPSQSKCIACKASLDSEAKLCPTCNSYQQKWKNTLKFWGSIVGAATILFTLITYLWTAIPNAFFKDNVSVLAFDGNRIALSNEGFGKVYLSHIFIESLDDSIDIAMLRQLGKTLDVGEIARISVKPYNNLNKGISVQFMGNCTDKEWKSALKQSEDKNNKCFYPAFYLKDGSTLTILKSEQDLRTFNGRATLTFYSNRQRKFYSKQFALIGTLMQNKSQECLIIEFE